MRIRAINEGAHSVACNSNNILCPVVMVWNMSAKANMLYIVTLLTANSFLRSMYNEAPEVNEYLSTISHHHTRDLHIVALYCWSVN